MNVVFVTLVDLTGTSGQNVYSRNVASALAGHKRVNLTLVCPEPFASLPTNLIDACRDIRTLPEKSSKSLRWHFLAQKTMFHHLSDVLRSDRIDLLLSTFRPSLIVPPYLARRLDIPYRILIEGKIGHGIDNLSVLPLDTVLSNLVLVWNLHGAERVYAANQAVKDWTQSLPFGDPSIEILPHGVDIPKILRDNGRLTTTNETLREHDFSVCYVGSFKEYHCLQPLIEGIAELRKNGVDIGLSLVGTGPTLESIREAASNHGIDAAVTFHGFVNSSMVPKYIQAADACYGVIDTDRIESPMKVYEYLSNGIPVIATKCAEFDFVEDDDMGVLIEEPSPKTVEKALERLLNIPEAELSRMGERARRAGCEYGHTWAEFADRVIAD